MDALLDQLGLDNTFFVELGIISVLFVALSQVYFKPFIQLFQARYKKTVEDKQAAEQLMVQAQAKLEEYKRLLTEERMATRREFESSMTEAKKMESQILAEARDEARKITQEAIDSINKQRGALKDQLESEVEVIAKGISERLLSRKV